METDALRDIAAALLLLGGSFLVFMAGLGVVRLQDTYLRMHAATKAGMAGTGLLLAGVALAFGGTDALLRVAVVILFLFLTTPLAAHALARAAYVAGAPLWSGTMTDQLQGRLGRGIADIDPARTLVRVNRAPTAGASTQEEKSAMSVTPLNLRAETSPRASSRSRSTSIRRVLVCVIAQPGGRAALGEALSLAHRHAAEATILSLIDMPMLRQVGPVPVGASWHARMLAEGRVARTRDVLSALTGRVTREARELGLAVSERHEEGDARKQLARLATQHDIVALPTGWFDHGTVLEGDRALSHLLSHSPRPLLLLNDARTISRVLFLHDGSNAAAEALRRYVLLRPWPDSELMIAGFGEPGDSLRGLVSEALDFVRSHDVSARDAGLLDHEIVTAADLTAHGADALALPSQLIAGRFGGLLVDRGARALREATVPRLLL